jgi:hypothetical protein
MADEYDYTRMWNGVFVPPPESGQEQRAIGFAREGDRLRDVSRYELEDESRARRRGPCQECGPLLWRLNLSPMVVIILYVVFVYIAVWLASSVAGDRIGHGVAEALRRMAPAAPGPPS